MSPVRSRNIALDNRRLLMVTNGTVMPSPVSELIVVQNWVEELKAKVPTPR